MSTPPSPHRPVLADPEADDLLAAQGYVIVPLLSAAEVDAIRTSQEAQRSADEDGLVIDFTVADRTAMNATRELLDPMLGAHIDDLLVHREPVMATFIVKHPGPASRMALHCEPSFGLDRERAFNVWIPLVDVSPQLGNGALHLLPGSEDLPLGWVGYNTPLLFRRYREQLGQRTVALSVRAGDAVVYDSRMLHWSESNAGSMARPAIALAVVPTGTQLVHVVATGRRHRRMYEVDRSFFVDIHPGDVPRLTPERYPFVGEFDDPQVLTPEAILATLGPPAIGDPTTVLPDHVHPEGSMAELSGCEVPGARLPTADVDVSAASLPQRPQPSTPGPVMSWDQPGARLLDLVDPAVPEAHRPGLLSLTGGHAGARALVVDPGTKVMIEPGPVALDVIAYDCAEVNCGLWCDDGIATLDPGRAVRVSGDAPIGIWNDGPGSAWIVLAPVPAHRRTRFWRRR